MKSLRRAVLSHRGWRYRTRLDPDEIRWMRSVLEPGDVAIDIGAYKGGYAYWMRREVGGTGTVYAFEPQREMAAYLRECVEAFAWNNVRVEEVALSSGRGERLLHRPSHTPSPGASLVGASLPRQSVSHDVRTDTLDGYLASKGDGLPSLRLIKCDVEGHELEVFRGAAATLTRHRPLLLFECEERHLVGHSMRDVFSYLEDVGYRGHFLWHGERLDVSDFDAREHQVEGRRPYGNNFIFEPVDEAGAS